MLHKCPAPGKEQLLAVKFMLFAHATVTLAAGVCTRLILLVIRVVFIAREVSPLDLLELVCRCNAIDQFCRRLDLCVDTLTLHLIDDVKIREIGLGFFVRLSISSMVYLLHHQALALALGELGRLRVGHA